MITSFFDEYVGTVTLCGSTKYFIECMEINRELTFKGWIVLMCGSWGHSYHKYAENTNTDYTLVKKLHFHKILMSDAIVVVSDKSGYIGESTKAEIEFAKHRNIPVFYFDGETISGVIGIKNNKSLNTKWDDSLIDTFAETNSLGF